MNTETNESAEKSGRSGLNSPIINVDQMFHRFQEILDIA
jgi:hypothetical protein